jgi:translation initiation factor 3 subunit D
LFFLDRYRSQYGVGVGMYQYVHEDDENTFQLVDSTRIPKPAYQKRPRFQQNVNRISKKSIRSF